MRSLILGSMAFLAAAACQPAGASENAPAPQRLEVLERYPIPPELLSEVPVGIQWSGRDSIYFGLLQAGVLEVSLEPELPRIRSLLTIGRGAPGSTLRNVARFFVSEDWVVVASKRLAWARRGSGEGTDGSLAVRAHDGRPMDIAVRGDDLIVLGFPDMEHYRAARGALVWEADLSRGLDHWEPIFEDEHVAEDPRVRFRDMYTWGSVAVLKNGDLVVAPSIPGVVPSVLRLSSAGKLKATWGPTDLWPGDPEAPGPEEQESDRPATFSKRLSKGRTIDDVLALREGPAILVREAGTERVRWRLALLGDEIQWFEIPTLDMTQVAYLKGDGAPDGRIVLAGVARDVFPDARVTKSEVLVARLPEPLPAPGEDQ